MCLNIAERYNLESYFAIFFHEDAKNFDASFHT